MIEGLAVLIAVAALVVSVYVYRRQSSEAEQTRQAVEQIARDLAAARAEAAEREAARSMTARASARRAAMYNEYILSHDGISAGIMAGTAPLPADWGR